MAQRKTNYVDGHEHIYLHMRKSTLGAFFLWLVLFVPAAIPFCFGLRYLLGLGDTFFGAAAIVFGIVTFSIMAVITYGAIKYSMEDE